MGEFFETYLTAGGTRRRVTTRTTTTTIIRLVAASRLTSVNGNAGPVGDTPKYLRDPLTIEARPPPSYD